MKYAFENLTYGVQPNSVAHVFTPSDTAKKLLFYPIWVGHYFCSPDYFIKRESLPVLQIMYIQSGNLQVTHQNQSFIAKKGDVVLLDCMEYHYYRAQENLEFYFYGFEGCNARELCQYILETHGTWIRSKNNVVIGNFMKNTLKYYEEYNSEDPFDASMRTYKLINFLFQKRDVFSITRSEPVEQSIAYINEHLKARITMEQLARMVGLNPSYFSRLFKAETGYSPREYITNERMSKAKLMLIQTNKSIVEIAYDLGYSNGVSFTNIFTERIGCSPKKFRNDYLNGI